MTPSRLAKIRAIAIDTRADPNTRVIAMEMLRLHAHFAPQSLRHPGLELDRRHERFIFSDMEQWRRVKTGGYRRSMMRNGKSYEVTLYKQDNDRFAWRIRLDAHNLYWSSGHVDLSEAREAAWQYLESLQ